MTQQAEPELVTSGSLPVRPQPDLFRLLTAMLGTALVNNLLGLQRLCDCALLFEFGSSNEELFPHA